jgi:hypothetical protein
MKRVRKIALPLAVFVTLTGLFMTCGSRERPWGDASIMYQVAESMVGKGRIDIAKEWPPMSHRGPDGKIYSQYSIGPSLAAAPGIALRKTIDGISPQSKPLTLVITSHLPQAMLGALACLLFFGLCRRMGAGLGSASIATVVLAVATSMFIYARSPFSEILQAACFTGFFAEVIRAPREPTRKRALWLGAWAGLLLNAKLVFAMSIAGGGVYIAAALWSRKADLLRVVKWGAVTGVPLLILALIYNHLRWGSPFDTGYSETLELLEEKTTVGLWGLLLSPGKSVFLYSPPLVLGALALPTLYRRHGHVVWAMALTVVPPLLVYGRFLSWAGDYAWGPRYLTYLLPVMLLPAVLWIDDLVTASRRWLARSAVAFVVVVGIAVQLLGAAFYWDHYIRISMKTRQQWLGTPNRGGAAIDERGRGHCDSCFEDMHGHQWLPPFSPIDGHWWMLRHVPFGHSWKDAQADAPWKRYTSLELNAGKSVYEASRIDWWGLIWIKEHKKLRGPGIAWLTIFGLMTLGGAIMWIRLVRRKDPEAAD